MIALERDEIPSPSASSSESGRELAAQHGAGEEGEGGVVAILLGGRRRRERRRLTTDIGGTRCGGNAPDNGALARGESPVRK